MAAISFHTYDAKVLVATVTLAGAVDGTVTPVITGVPKNFRVETARVFHTDMGSAQTADIGFNGGDQLFDGIDTGTAASTAPGLLMGTATTAGVLNTADNATITFKNIGAAATGSLRLEVIGRMDYTV